MDVGKAVVLGAVIIGAAIAFPMTENGRFEIQSDGSSNAIIISDTDSGKAWWCPRAKYSKTCEPYKFPKKEDWTSQ